MIDETFAFLPRADGKDEFFSAGFLLRGISSLHRMDCDADLSHKGGSGNQRARQAIGR